VTTGRRSRVCVREEKRVDIWLPICAWLHWPGDGSGYAGGRLRELAVLGCNGAGVVVSRGMFSPMVLRMIGILGFVVLLIVIVYIYVGRKDD